MTERPISELADINPCLTKLPSDTAAVSFVTMADVSESGRLLSHRPRPFGEVKAGFTRFQDGDVLFAKITPCMENGKGAIVFGLEGGIGCGSTEFHVLRVRGNNDPWYLYQWLQWGATRQKAQLFMSGSAGQQRVPAEFFRQFRIPAPEPAAQQRIAAILTSLDNAIEATEALIEKHQQIKAGLMHDLFTRGVLPSGAMRPSASDAPTMYNETPLGLLPKGWTVQSVVDLLAPVANNLRSGPFGSALLKHELSESGVPLLGIDNIHVERFVPLYSRFLDRRKFMTLARYAVRPGDVIITIMGTVGRSCVVPNDIGTALSSKHLWTMTLNAGRVIPDLVCWQLNHAPWARAWFRRGGQGGIMDAIQSSTLKTLRLPTPPFEEQIQIANIYRAMQSRIDCDAARLEKLRAQKHGLMQDLLTGKVRVPVPKQEAIA